MGVNTKVIKNRIKSVASTKKITKAMEMISAVKMRKAANNVLASRSYADLAWKMLRDITSKTNLKLHPLLEKREVKKIGVVIITSNRGLAGGFISRLLSETDKFLKEKNEKNIEIEVLLNGRSGKKIYHQYGYSIVAEFEKKDITMKAEEVSALSDMMVSEYIANKYDEVYIAYTDYVSVIKQIPRIKKILPLSDVADNMLGNIGEPSEDTDKLNENIEKTEFLFEPTAKNVLDALLPRLVEVQLYQAVLESDASEHSARMMAMRNASDAAEDMITELNYNFNKARQAAITQEISEIVAGAISL